MLFKLGWLVGCRKFGCVTSTSALLGAGELLELLMRMAMQVSMMFGGVCKKSCGAKYSSGWSGLCVACRM